MENIPPSYETATARNPWQLVAPYIPSTDLCALNRVNRKLHKVFAPYLWGNPASHFGTENDRVYVALTRFKRILKRVRLSVRELTHTLHLPPAQSEIYDGPRPEWLRDVLQQLPNLQSLVVSRLPFFDHMALLSLRGGSESRRHTSGEAGQTYALRLLIAAHCENTTSHGLAEALQHFSNLAFLDLSNTLAARDKSVLLGMRNMPLLQVLKLRNIHLRDEDMVILAEAIGVRVRSLDVQGNHLTDHSVRTLLGASFQAPDDAHRLSNGRADASSNLVVEDWPSGFVRPDPTVLDEFRDESYDERFVRRLTSGITSRLPYEDFALSGITHLYIADNNLTVEGLASLVRSRMLHVLDAGSLNQGSILNRPLSSSFTSTPHPHDDNRHVRIPGVEKLTPVLGKFGMELTSLRLHYAIVSEIAPAIVEEPLRKSEISSDDSALQELEGTSVSVEMDATPPLYELEPREPVPRLELPGDSAYFVVSPAVGDKPTLTKEESQPEANRGSVFAPEVVEKGEESEEDATPVLTATGLGSMAQGVNGIASPELSKSTEERTESFGPDEDGVKMQITLIEKQRQELRSARLDKPHGLIPGMLPNLRTLTLTDVPSYTTSPKVAEALIEFIKDCAAETELAKFQARLEPDHIRRPGGRQYKQQHNSSARKIFALRRIVLEMAPGTTFLSPQRAQTSKFTRSTKSSTEDADSEALWSAAENDFTFFDDDDEECGLPAAEPGSWIPYSALTEKIMMPSDGPQNGKLPTLQQPARKDASVDVVQKLSKFRKERKAAFENAVSRGVHHVGGYWPGEVKVLRGQHAGGETDYYGNHYEKWGLYR